MGTLDKGRLTEAAVLNAFAQRDLAVLVPFGDGRPYDLVVDLDDAHLRVQCKTARPYPGGIRFNTRSTDHGRGRLSYAGLADVFGVCFPDTGQVYLVPVMLVSGFEFNMRLEPTRNNQRLRIRMASDYEFDRWTNEALHELCGLRIEAPVLAA